MWWIIGGAAAFIGLLGWSACVVGGRADEWAEQFERDHPDWDKQ